MGSQPRSARPPVLLEAQVFIALQKIADALAQEAEQLLKAHGLTGAQYNVLRILRGAEPEGLACSTISDRMISHDPDMTRLLDRMEKRALITRQRQKDDRRVVKTRITPAGLDLLKGLDEPVREVHTHTCRAAEDARGVARSSSSSRKRIGIYRGSFEFRKPDHQFKSKEIVTMGVSLARIALTAGLAAILSLPASAATSTWQIDPQHTAAQFSVRHLAISTVRGGFSKVTGTVVLDDKDVAKSSVDVTIDVSTVDTREPNRDKDLKSDKFFDVEHYPTMTFKSKKVEQNGVGKLKVTGDLTIRGVTKEVVLDIDGPTAPVKDPWGNQRAAVNATTKVNRQDYGVKWNATMDNGGVVVGDDVSINIDAEMVQKNAAKSGN
jgi:polyisoprenoid-binding protein YceI/DNA-binding MarR family transcriptional regulator